jgi:uncharacterized protein
MPQPQADGGVQARHQAELDAGRFLIQRCGACGRHVYFPRELCPHCGATGLAWVAPSGRGTVHAITVVRRKAQDGGDYNVSLIDLEEGVRMMSRVEGGGPVRIGDAVRLRQPVVGGVVLFEPEQARP